MRGLRTLIVDDESLARERLRRMMTDEPDLVWIGECTKGSDAVAFIREQKPDLVFLDVQMTDGDGLQVVARLPEENRPVIIFATAHERFAVEAFAVAAVDYLLKPFDRDRFRQAVRRAQEHFQARAADAAAAQPRRGERMTVRSGGRILFLRPEEIIWVEADDNHAVLHLATGCIVVRETMGALEGRLGANGFTRVNRSALVQFDQIRELQPTLHGDHVVLLRDGTKLPVSRGLGGQLGLIASGG